MMALLLLCGASGFALQDKISPLSDYQYKKDYAQYEEIKKEADIQKRADLLLGFVKERPISRILLYVVTDYQAAINPQLEKKDWAKAISMSEALLSILPTEEKVKAEEIPVGSEEFLKDQLAPSVLLLERTMLAAQYGAGNLPKAAELAEKIYAAAPDASMLQTLAAIYLNMQNFDKYLEYGQKILAQAPMDQPLGYTTALQMADIHLRKQDVPAATAMFSKIMAVYGDKVPPNMAEPQWNATRAIAFGLMGADAYQKKDYPGALGLYQKVVQFDPKRDDAWYYIGMSKWQTEGQDAAVEPFAKCVVLEKTMAPRAKQYLEQIYQGSHSGSLEGIEEVLTKARADLGI
jgi:tetratricopeptide (TPR) repeat protein